MDIKQKFTELKIKNKTGLIPFIVAGDPLPEYTVNLMHSLVKSGADIIELGIPFSDPMADGSVIQKAADRALKNKVNLPQIFQMVKDFRKDNSYTPIILMGYLNPIEFMGYSTFTKLAKVAGVNGVIIVDMPPEESKEYLKEAKDNNLDSIYLLSSTTSKTRLKAINEIGSGFVYYVSLNGVTGSKKLNVDNVCKKLEYLYDKISLPIGIGFGINDAKSAYQMAKLGDAIIVGSALVSVIEEYSQEPYELIEKKLSNKMIIFNEAVNKADRGA